MSRAPQSTGYKVRKSGTSSFAITVPFSVARLIPDDARFDIELTEDGMLYRFRHDEVTRPLPDWVKPDA